MSIAHYKHIWSNYPEIKGSQKLVLLALAEFANEDNNECWPSIARLSEMTGLKDRQVQNILRELKEDGYIEIEVNHGRKNTNVYRLTMKEKVQSSAPFNESEKVQSSDKKVQSSTEKVQSSDIKGALGYTRSVIEPPIEPIEPPIDASRQTKKPVATPKAETKQPDNLVKAILDAYVEVRGSNSINYGKEGSWAKRIAKDGTPPEMVKACYEWLKQDKFWEFKPLSLAKVYENLPEFKRYIERRGLPQTGNGEWLLVSNQYEGTKYLVNTVTGEKKPYVNA